MDIAATYRYYLESPQLSGPDVACRLPAPNLYYSAHKVGNILPGGRRRGISAQKIDASYLARVFNSLSV